MPKTKHIYILDTCVLLHDPHAIYRFEEHDIYIPIAVIDDLDEIKVKRDNVGWSAREVLRQFNHFSINELSTGIKITEKGGKLFIYNNNVLSDPDNIPVIARANSDNALIEASLKLQSEYPKRKVCLVTKDIGLMVRAAAYNIITENYRHDMIDADIFKGYQVVQVDAKYLIDKLYSEESIPIGEFKDILTKEVYQNEFVIFKYGEANTAITIRKDDMLVNCIGKGVKLQFMGITPKNLEQKLSICLLKDESIPLVSLVGKAGTGKSICALAVGLQQIKNGVYDKLVVVKPLVPVGGKEIGFLPGDKFSKISAWLGPIKDNIEQLVNFGPDVDKNDPSYFEEMCEKGIIEVEAMTFIQGRSITNSFILLDECLTKDSMIYTADGKLVKIQDIKNESEVISFNTNDQSWSSNIIKSKFSRHTDNYLKIYTSRGILECTKTHPMWVYENGLTLTKKEAQQITSHDLIPVPVIFPHIVKNNVSVSEAGMAALILTDGHIEKNRYTIKVDMSKDQSWLKNTFDEFSKKIFTNFKSDNANNARKNMICRVYGKKEICQFADKFGIPHGKKSNIIEVPELIWNAPNESVKKFIQICFDAEGDVNIFPKAGVPHVVVSMASSSKSFVYQMQALLLKFGIDSHIYTTSKGNDKRNTGYKVSIVGGYMSKMFFEKIGFSISRKQNRLLEINDFIFECPYIYPRTIATKLYQSLEDNGRWKPKDKYYKSDMNTDLNNRVSHYNGPSINHSTLEKVNIVADKINYNLCDVIACCRVNKVELIDEQKEVYDFEVENDHTFVVNGIVSSNCENVSPREARMFVERCGKNSKVVLLGDLSQIENPYLDQYSCGLTHAIQGGKTSKLAGSVQLNKVERSPLSEAATEIFKKGLEI